MRLALDASIVVDWALQERSPTAAAALTQVVTEGAVVPALWWFEVRNGLLVAERRKRTSEALSTRFLRDLADLSILTDRQPEEAVLMRLARRHRLTAYDAAYLELALRERTALATLDQPLAAAARREGIDVLLGASA